MPFWKKKVSRSYTRCSSSDRSVGAGSPAPRTFDAIGFEISGGRAPAMFVWMPISPSGACAPRTSVISALQPPEVVLGLPVAGECLDRRELHTLRQVVYRLLLGPARPRYASAEVVELL